MTFRQGAALHAFTLSRRRVLSAFVLGAAISAAGLATLASGVAGARGPFVPAADAPVSSGAADGGRIAIVSYWSHGEPRHARAEDDKNGAARRHGGVRASVKIAPGGHDPVCVRLCDGYFFPLPTGAADAMSQGAACNSLCPDAPTEVFYRNGADKIEDSVSAGGRLYSALPISLRYRSTFNETCSCHREAVAYAPLRDPTLKRGDAIMTPAGFMVFRGVEGTPHQADDFSALTTAGMPASAAAPLKEMERASLTPAHPSLKQWLASQNAPTLAYRAAPPQAGVALVAAPAHAAAASGEGKIRLLAWRGAEP